ncbi:hypothetical protein VMCG_07252 [Cytospora schulzeri]|uniref:protein-ribulosamine 3-kinase n=1 Tax=Cytospora schulzeri TaxID=448051 RepID=A0A423WAF7_9PEZI|nr:hypothetical protein VMCG_07252 [Valsa malicola]
MAGIEIHPLLISSDAEVGLRQTVQTSSDQASLVDPAIVKVLEKGVKVVQVKKHGESFWAGTFKIDCETEAGECRSYFLKTLSSPDAAERVYGEFRSMKEIHETLPTAVPTPRGYGPCCHEPGTYFYICDYIEATRSLPDHVRLGFKLAELHHNSRSPNGMFGFHCPTYDGDQVTNTTWDSSWTRFFKRRVHEAYMLDLERNGHWKLYEDVVKVALDGLIPRLLDVLTENGRSIRPVLIHGDLWESNIGTEEATDEIYFWDACAYYAHHERDVAIWRCAHHRMTDEKYRDEYFKNYPPSEPMEEADDRNRLYSVEILMNNGLSLPGSKTRQLAVQELQYLIAKYLPESQLGK